MALLSGTPAAGSGGVYTLTLTAHNGVGSDALQTFTLTINSAPNFTSANGATFTVGSAGSFTIAATGFPTPSLSRSGVLPAGVTFVDHGNGTALLSGTPAAKTGGLYPITLTAHNGAGSDAVQHFTLTVNQPAAITSFPFAFFQVGRAGSVTIKTTGFPPPSLKEAGTLPAGLAFVDNGNGTATLSGTPANRTWGIYILTITAHNGVGVDKVQTFYLFVFPADD
jgi:hypothetical protein